ncbi:MAG: helix-turn-helix transcriptional regulator [Clostridia bacterium]|nr:helix-turn-helix transcriptional regulator [Clostridia bacterium]MBO7659243.1 helix-turn-helix transcriptional regulator [Clostridia bacterium]MBP5665375.1 helix-turn-helix transcriptional regulator [Clostridia bacterium]MBR5005743.1 helix-turn-helix transcriptional regulator [Clostridia bacterium]
MVLMNGLEICDSEIKNADLEQKVRDLMPSEESLFSLADFFRVFGDSTRIKILYALFESELCVCDIAGTLNMTVSAVSHQLKTLKQARLVSSKRNGKSVIYFLADDHVKTVIDQAVEHLNEDHFPGI